MQFKSKSKKAQGFVVGEPFIPYRLFAGIFIPEALCSWSDLSPGAKLCYARLARYAGEDGKCFPGVETLAQEIGVGRRQCQRYMSELELRALIRRQSRYVADSQISNQYEFLWHEVFECARPRQQRRDDRSDTLPMTDLTPTPVTLTSPKESQTQESQIEESHINNTDIDQQTTNRKNHDSSSGICVVHPSNTSEIRQYPFLKEALRQAFHEPGQVDLYPSDRTVVDVMDWAGGASEEEVIVCLKYLTNDRGLKPGTKYGPRHWAWFKHAVANHFAQKRARGF
jgi:hypothetical protein